MKRKLDIGNIYGSKEEVLSNGSSTTINTYTNLPYSSKYYEILRKRQILPVYEFKNELIEKVKQNQTIVVEGETGSGKKS